MPTWPPSTFAASSVYWAGAVPVWFDLAREITERWVHYRQIQGAVLPAPQEQGEDEYLPLVLRTFIWGFPRQYQAEAPGRRHDRRRGSRHRRVDADQDANGLDPRRGRARQAEPRPADERRRGMAAADRCSLRHPPGGALGRPGAGETPAPSPRHHRLAARPGLPGPSAWRERRTLAGQATMPANVDVHVIRRAACRSAPGSARRRRRARGPTGGRSRRPSAAGSRRK